MIRRIVYRFRLWLLRSVLSSYYDLVLPLRQPDSGNDVVIRMLYCNYVKLLNISVLHQLYDCSDDFRIDYNDVVNLMTSIEKHDAQYAYSLGLAAIMLSNLLAKRSDKRKAECISDMAYALALAWATASIAAHGHHVEEIVENQMMQALEKCEPFIVNAPWKNNER